LKKKSNEKMKNTIIKYKIDNFSGLLSVVDFKSHYKSNNFHYRDERRKPPFIKNNMSGCYFLYNEVKEIIYIGKSINCIRQRLIDHLFRKNNGYSHDEAYNFRHDKKQKEAIYFSFITVDKNKVQVVEPFLIDKYKPIYNIEFNNVC
tara:strand:+ start:27 stop:467 length:441 start_codon:yes stop_codon:yes gene_type:complete